MGSAAGVLKKTAAELGLSVAEYEQRVAAGLKRCTRHKAWCPRSQFGKDASRPDGLASNCRDSLKTGRPRGWRGTPAVNPATGRPGPAPKSARDGDKPQARQRINVEVRTGRRPNPNTLPCADCGHIGSDRRHEYDHHKGYAPEHHLNVQAVCTKCHSRRDKPPPTHCKNGHEFTSENTVLRKNGTRQCRPCRRINESSVRDAAWWRARKARKAAERG